MIWKQVNIFLPGSQTVVKEEGVTRWHAPLCSFESHLDSKQKIDLFFSAPSWNWRNTWLFFARNVELWTFGSKPVLEKEVRKESILIWYFSDMGTSRKYCKFYEKNYSVVIHTPNVKAYVLKRASRCLSTVWEAGAWFTATLIFHLSSWVRCEAVAKVGSAPAILTPCHNNMLWLWAALSLLSFIFIDKSALYNVGNEATYFYPGWRRG